MTSTIEPSTIEPDAFLAACPSRALLALIGQKWSTLVLAALADGPVRFGALHRRLEGISRKVLTQTLRVLEREGLIERAAYDERLPRVEYALSPLGADLLPLVIALKRWAERHFRAVEAHRAAFDAADGSSSVA